MCITPFLANSPDLLVLVGVWVSVLIVPAVAIAALVVNAQRGMRRWWGFLMGVFAAVAAGLGLCYFHKEGGPLVWAGVGSLIVSGCSVLLWARGREG